MLVNFAQDTGRALREFAGACESRSLLQQRFGLFDDRSDGQLDAARRLALDLWVDGGRADVEALTATAREAADKREGRHGLTDPEARKLRILQSIGERMIQAFPCWVVRPPDRDWLATAGTNHRKFKLVTRQRLAIGLANGAWENSGLTLHRRFGYPLIPGSALKGLALRGALDLSADKCLREVVLGNEPDAEHEQPARAGAVAFLDAVAEEATVELDIVTPHYGDYYSESLRNPNPQALDTEQPKPNVFPVVAPGARFRFDLLLVRGRDLGRFTGKDALDEAEQWITHALNVLGAGAKSRSGYGRFGDLQLAGTANALFPGAGVHAAAPSVNPPQTVLTPAEACVAKWRGKVPTFDFLMQPFIADLAALDNADLRSVARQLIKSDHWDAGRPANPPTNPFWKDFAKAPGGAAVLAKLMNAKP